MARCAKPIQQPVSSPARSTFLHQAFPSLCSRPPKRELDAWAAFKGSRENKFGLGIASQVHCAATVSLRLTFLPPQVPETGSETSIPPSGRR